LAHMSISTYFRPNIHQNGPEILGVNEWWMKLVERNNYKGTFIPRRVSIT
jgi:hypothetical protein